MRKCTLSFITIGFLFIVISACNKPNYSGNNERSSNNAIPITIQYNQYGWATPVVKIGISNVDTLDVLLDVGSSGLRILKGAVSNVFYQSSNTRVDFSYGTPSADFFISGAVAKGYFSLGSMKTDSAISFMVIDSAKYGSGGNYASTGDSIIIASTTFKNLCGVLGVSLRYSSSYEGIASPLAQLKGSNGQFIIELPKYGGTQGSLVINPSQEDLDGFTLFHLSQQGTLLPGNKYYGWVDNQLNGCFIINGQYFWANTWLDSGNPEIKISSPSIVSTSTVPTGDMVTFGIADEPYGDFRIQNTFTVGSIPENGKDLINLLPAISDSINLPGIMPFFIYDVLYDQQNGIIGLRQKR